MKKLRAADLFCGAGGTSIGAAQTGEVNISFAVNHWDIAIKTHSKNFPKAKHVHQSLKWVHPSEADKINLLFASPECTHHSRARGGRPTTDQQRSGAWELMPWIEHHRPSHLIVENVAEFEEWGPVDHKTGTPLQSMKGHFFDAWLSAIASAGYRVEHRKLNAADYGAATSRERLFIIARKGRRSVCWPEPTHCKDSSNCLPGFEQSPWRGAIEIIDWSIPLPSVFGRKRPLADKTLARIEKGLARHVAPMVVRLRNHGTAEPVTDPLGTVTAGGLHHGVSVPFVQTVNHGGDDHRTRSVGDVLPTMTSSKGEAICAPMLISAGGREVDARMFDGPMPTLLTHQNLAIACPFLVPRHGERKGQDPRTHSAADPYPTIATSNSPSLAVPMIMSAQQGGIVHDANTHPVPTVTTKTGAFASAAFITSFYGTQNTSEVNRPCPTVTTVDRHAATVAAMGDLELPAPRTDAERSLMALMTKLGVFDIGFRMLSNGELADAQGFPMEYQFCGTKKDVTRQIGNSVSPPVARAMTEALLS